MRLHGAHAKDERAEQRRDRHAAQNCGKPHERLPGRLPHLDQRGQRAQPFECTQHEPCLREAGDPALAQRQQRNEGQGDDKRNPRAGPVEMCGQQGKRERDGNQRKHGHWKLGDNDGGATTPQL